MTLLCVSKFSEIYGQEPDAVSFCPYRICPIGAHSDANFGKITGLALDRGVHIAWRSKQNGVIELKSINFAKRAQFHVDSIPAEKQNDWADYLRGAVIALRKNHILRVGVAGVIEGSLPIGGLSSSAAVIMAFLQAICQANGILLTPTEMIQTALSAENDYVGVACGKLDQSCEVYSQKDHLLYLDTQNDSFELIPVPPQMKPWKIMIFFSGVERTLVGSKFNMRVDESRAAAYALLAYAGMPYGKFHESALRQVPRSIFDAYKNRLPENWRRRAEHWFSEFERVEAGVDVWRRGDIEAFGKLSFESGYSSIVNWETGSPELKKLYDIMRSTDGIYGGRFSGAGFKGCCMALIDPAYEEKIRAKVAAEYLKEFPALKDSFSIHCCNSANGIGKLLS